MWFYYPDKINISVTCISCTCTWSFLFRGIGYGGAHPLLIYSIKSCIYGDYIHLPTQAEPVLPLKDPTSDMAVIARSGSKLVKEVCGYPSSNHLIFYHRAEKHPRLNASGCSMIGLLGHASEGLSEAATLNPKPDFKRCSPAMVPAGAREEGGEQVSQALLGGCRVQNRPNHWHALRPLQLYF